MLLEKNTIVTTEHIQILIAFGILHEAFFAFYNLYIYSFVYIK